MTLLLIGVIEWSIVHWLRRLVPNLRAAMTQRMGGASRGVIAVLIVMSLGLMVWGYRQSDFIEVWTPPSFFGHINNLLMLVAFYCYGASAAKGAKVWLGTKIRHPQLAGFSIWAVAHLLANGDLASIVLFGGLLIWAQGSIFLINREQGPWTRPERAPFKKEIVLVVISLVLFSVVAGIHLALGVSPFGGV